MTTTIDLNEDRILIKYVDSNLNTYKCVITKTDIFVLNFCKKDLSRMRDILENNELVEMNDYYLLRVEKPVFLEYELKRELQNEVTNFSVILDRFGKIEEKVKNLENMIEEKCKIIEYLFSKVDDVVLLPGYECVIPKNCEYIDLYKPEKEGYTLPSYESQEISTRCYFIGESIEAISQLTELKYIGFHGFRKIDLMPLLACKNLSLIRFKNCVVPVIPDFGRKVTIEYL